MFGVFNLYSICYYYNKKTNGVNYNSTETICIERRKQIEMKTVWIMDKFGNIFEYTDWDKGPGGLHAHSTCYIALSSKWSLQ